MPLTVERRRRPQLWATALLLTLLPACTGSGGSDHATPSPSQDTAASAAPSPSPPHRGEQITVGFKNDQPNVSQLTPGDKERTGFEQSLAHSVLNKALGFDVVSSPTTAEGWEKQLDDRQVRVILSSVSRTDERNARHIFAGPYLQTAFGALVAENSTLTEEQVSGLKGITVCYTKETTAQALAEKWAADGKDVTLDPQDSSENCQQNLRRNPDEVFVSDRIILNGLSISVEGAGFRLLDTDLGAPIQTYAIALRPEDRALCLEIDKALDAYLEPDEGKWFQDFKDWFVDKAGKRAYYERTYRPDRTDPTWCNPSSSDARSR